MFKVPMWRRLWSWNIQFSVCLNLLNNYSFHFKSIWRFTPNLVKTELLIQKFPCKLFHVQFLPSIENHWGFKQRQLTDILKNSRNCFKTNESLLPAVSVLIHFLVKPTFLFFKGFRRRCNVQVFSFRLFCEIH